MRIQRDVPPPPPWERTIYPFRQMEIGDSLYAEGAAGTRLRTAVKVWKHRHSGWNYAARKEGDGLRVWRIS